MLPSATRKPRIFIGAPVYSKVDHEVLEDWMRFAYHCGRRMPQYDFYLGIKPKSEQFRARNEIVMGALQTDSDWLLMLDDDMIVNTFVTAGRLGEGDDSYGFLEKLLSHNKDVCGVLYWQRGGNCEPVLMKRVNENGYRFLREDELVGGLQRVDVAGGGCLLVRMSIFDKIKAPYFAPEFKHGTDVQLCERALEAGFEVWADTSIEFGHLKDEKVIVTRRNRRQLQLEESIPGDTTRQFVAADIYTRLIEDATEFTGRPNIQAMEAEADDFMRSRTESGLSDADWYREFPMERVCRQVWFNTTDQKKQMTQFIISAVDRNRKFRILDFGCGIGIPAFELASQGHDVTAMDIRGTGTLEFLKWRCAKHGVNVNVVESEGGVPVLSGEYDIIIAMDCIEHIQDWKAALATLTDHLKPNGAMFSNNGILDDNTHPEHYVVPSKDFVAECVSQNVMPVNQITYVKREVPVYA